MAFRVGLMSGERTWSEKEIWSDSHGLSLSPLTGFPVPCLFLLLNEVGYFFCLQWKLNGFQEKSCIWKRLTVLSSLASWHMCSSYPPAFCARWEIVTGFPFWQIENRSNSSSSKKSHVPILLPYLLFNFSLICRIELAFLSSPTESWLFVLSCLKTCLKHS